MADVATDRLPYYPPPESQGGWRTLPAPRQAGMDVEKLAAAREWNARLAVPSAIVIIRHGYLVAEWYEQGATPTTAFNIHSCTKSFTGTAFGLLFDDARRGALPGAERVALESPAYAFIPEGHPLTDPRKERITLRHLLSMSSGIAGESIGIFGTPTEPGVNPFVAALGFAPLRARGATPLAWVSQLAAEPGTRWDYSDPAFAHLGLAFRHITGEELGGFLQRRVFGPLGIESLTWDLLGLDDGRIGRHNMPQGGIHVAARDLARFGYLMLRRGVWHGAAIVAPWWLELATRPSQALNPQYGLTWWVNSEGTWPAVPRDTFAAMGFNCNVCYIVPSADLVAVRIGAGPASALDADPTFIAAVCAAVAADTA